ncbi:Nucleotidyltransferase family protein [Trifolium repens]|nr:Nucleotidyltransferase family protein [Trifolium repens]
MAHRQLMDSLTSHISLYHSQSPNPNPNPNPRSSILKWFSSLSIHHRLSHLTILDSNFVQILLQMLSKLQSNNNHGCFILLPDLPSRDPPFLPTLCFKKSHGLIARIADSDTAGKLIFDSVRLFASREGENASKCSCDARCLDAVTFCEGIVEDVDRFVEVMDKISGGGFLRGEENEIGEDWVELNWLKSKGYYGIEAFIANRIEVSIRLAWLNSCGGKKRGVKLKEKLNVAGLAANVYWRKKGCVDWWGNLDSVTRKKVFKTIIMKSAKALTYEVLKVASSAPEDEVWLYRRGTGVDKLLDYNCTGSAQRTTRAFRDDTEFGRIITPVSVCKRPAALARVFDSLSVLQDINIMLTSCINSEYDIGTLFFSSLVSVSTISDCILRKLRGFLMVISLDCTKHELLEEEHDKSSSGKPKEKLGLSNRKKKGRTRNNKRQNPAPKTPVSGISCKNLHKDVDCVVDNKKKTDLTKPGELPQVPPVKNDISMENSSSPVKIVDCTRESNVGKPRTTPRKSRKEKNRNKNKSTLVDSAVVDSHKSVTHAASTTVVSKGEVEKCNRSFDSSTIQNVKNKGSIGNDILVSNSIPCSLNGPAKENSSTGKVEGKNVDDLAESCNSSGSQFCLSPNERKMLSCELDTRVVECKTITQPVPALKHSNFSSNEDTCSLNTTGAATADVKSTIYDKPIREVNVKEFGMLKERDRCLFESRNSAFSKCSPYEWPGIPSIYFPSFNSHLPPATDRLHLDVGRNWHNHFCHPFVPTLPQARNTPIEGGCNPIMSRQIPMSFDWPPVFRGGVTPSPNCKYDSGFMSRRQCKFSKGLAVHGMHLDVTTSDDERKYSGDTLDLPDLINTQFTDEYDNLYVSEEEYDFHAVSGIDYNQYFGGGVMYWNPSEHSGKGFSRPPSLSSDDSLWALREADMNQTVDDMVAFSSSYSTNGLASPTTATFCSPFDPVGTGPQTVGYVMSSNDVPGKVMHSSSVTDAAVDDDTSSGSLGNNLPGEIEGKAGDSHPYPILRPIIIPNLSRERSVCVDHKSPCVPPTRREQPRIKRPPSPVVLCVPRAPRPPPPSSVSDSRKQRGFPTVRSGSSSPRHWGMRGWYHDGSNLEDTCLRMDGAEVVWPSWRGKNLAVQPLIQPLPAALLQDRLIAMSQIARDQEHPDVTLPLQPPELRSSSATSASLSSMHGTLHDEIDFFCKQVAAENMARRPYINWAVKRVTRSLQVLWPRSRTNIFGSNATGMALPTSDVDLVVSLPPVRNLEPIKEAGILEGRNGIKETCLQHAARYLANQEWVKNDSLKTVENTAIPIIMLVVEVPEDVITSSAPTLHSLKEKSHCTTGEHDSKSVRVDISFKSPSHTGLQTTGMVKELTEQFPAATPLALVLKQFLADRSLDQSYSGGLSSYCLVLLIIRFLQHEHHLGRPINQNYGSLLVDFLYFFGNVFDPRQMRISVQGSGLYIKRERGCSIDPIHIDDPLFPTNNVGRNCFRIHQCIKAFSEAYSVLENELTFLNGDGESCSRPSYRLLPKIIPSLDVS